MNELPTVSEVTRRLGIAERRDIDHESATRWLRRHLKRRQQQTGKRILVLVGEGSTRPTYRVDMELLEIACPELFSTRSELARALRSCAIVGQRELRTQGELLEELVEKVNLLAARAARRR